MCALRVAGRAWGVAGFVVFGSSDWKGVDGTARVCCESEAVALGVSCLGFPGFAVVGQLGSRLFRIGVSRLLELEKVGGCVASSRLRDGRGVGRSREGCRDAATAAASASRTCVGIFLPC